MGENIEAITKYLEALRDYNVNPAAIVINSVECKVIKINNRDQTMDLAVTVKLNGSTGEGSSVKATVVAGEKKKTISIVNRDTASLLLEKVPVAVTQINVTVDGKQDQAESVYFYSPKGDKSASQSFIGVGSGMTEVQATATVNIGNADHKIKLVKVAAFNGDQTEIPVEGAEFDLYCDEEKIGGPYITDVNGEINVELWNANKAISGNYYFKESKAPEGFKFDPDKEYQISTSSNEIKASNDGDVNIELTKEDVDTGKVIKGAVFKLEHESGKWALEKATDDQGKISFTGLIPGTYTLTEVTSAEGYKKQDQKITFTIVVRDGQVQITGTVKTIEGQSVKLEDQTFKIEGTSISVTNEQKKGNLSVEKKVQYKKEQSEDPDLNREFKIFVKLGSGSEETRKVDVATEEPIEFKFNNNTADVTYEFELKDGQKVTIEGIPLGTHYEVTEEAPGDNWKYMSVSPSGGTIEKEDETVEVVVTNTWFKTKTTSLTVHKDWDIVIS